MYTRALLLSHAQSLSPSSFHKTKSKSLFVVKNSRVCWLDVKDDVSNTKNVRRVIFLLFFLFLFFCSFCSLDDVLGV